MNRKGERSLSVLLIDLIILTMAIAMPPKVLAQGTRVWVDPSYYLGTHVSETFIEEIEIENIQNLQAFEYRLAWNGTLIKLIKVEIFLPWSSNFIAKNETGELRSGKTYFWLGAIALYPTPLFTGSTVVTRLTFQVEYEPHYPEPDMSTC